MMAKESLSLLFLLIATACALKCYQHATVKCGDHDALYNTTCTQLEEQTTEMISVTCGGGFDRCASGEMTYSISGLEISAKFQSCSSGETGCLENVDEAITDQLETAPALPSLPAIGLSVETKDFCKCEGDLCNSALLNACSISILLLSVLLALFI